MKQLRSRMAIILAAVILGVGHVLSMPLSALASSETPPIVPQNIAVPAGSVLLFSRHARGVQIYECQNGQWTLHAPRAVLFDRDSNQATGFHYGGIDRGLTPGPWWESMDDGSRIRAVVVDRAPSPNPESIPLFLLKVSEWYGTGVFTPVSHIQRLNTVDGVSPTGACRSGAQRSVPYTADYYFYAAP
jgi:Protein of unknown function (DUF3455)